ncbi:MAG: methylamine utilization protein MauJ [Gammaproteobacteria bacterium]
MTLNAPDADFQLVLSDMPEGHDLPNAVLSAQLIFECASFEAIREKAFNKLAFALNALAFATNRKFMMKRLKRVIDWTPGIVERQAIIYAEIPEWDVAEPALDDRYVQTAERFMSMQSGEEQQRAMRWYRLAIQAENVEEQFSYFWFALEIAAQSLKGPEKVPSKCPHCRGPLHCEACKKIPFHRQYAGEAIHKMVERIHPEDADEVFETLSLVRHTLMHGGRISSVASELPCTQEQVLNKVAFVTWQAIGYMFSKPDPLESEDQPFNCGYVENVVRRTMVASTHVSTTLLRGDPDNPQLVDFPEIKTELTQQFVPAGHSAATSIE